MVSRIFRHLSLLCVVDTIEDEACRTGHVDVVVVAPVNGKITAEKVYLNLSVCPACQCGGYSCGTCARSAGERLSAAAFPHTHAYVATVDHLGELLSLIHI